MIYRRTGRSGLMLPALSVGLWQRFGGDAPSDENRAIIRRAFELGVTHFDLANNYGPPYGSAESNFGRMMQSDLKGHRDELVISTKAGWDMWPGPYGDWGSRKYLLASLDQSLKRMGLEYVDIFYHHRPDPESPLEETMGALETAVRRGKALYVGISQYQPAQTREAVALLKERRIHLLIHQRLLDAQSMDRAGAARCTRGGGGRLHRVLAAGAGDAHRSIPAGRAGRFARNRGLLAYA